MPPVHSTQFVIWCCNNQIQACRHGPLYLHTYRTHQADNLHFLPRQGTWQQVQVGSVVRNLISSPVLYIGLTRLPPVLVQNPFAAKLIFPKSKVSFVIIIAISITFPLNCPSTGPRPTSRLGTLCRHASRGGPKTLTALPFTGSKDSHLSRPRSHFQ